MEQHRQVDQRAADGSPAAAGGAGGQPGVPVSAEVPSAEHAQRGPYPAGHGTREVPGQGAGVSKLAAKMAHELNNPLDAVLRFVSLAQRKAKAGDYGDIERYLADAQFGLQRMTEILRELMDMGRETHAILSRPAAMPLADLIERATRTTAALAEQKHVTLVVKSLLGEAAPPPGYDLRVAQVLSNLLKNAVEAAPEGSAVRLTVSLREQDGGKVLALVVEDCGAGVAAELLPKLFTPFVTSKGKGAGLGLGLAISRELAASLGGAVVLENRAALQTGCVATLTLPMTSGQWPVASGQNERARSPSLTTDH